MRMVAGLAIPFVLAALAFGCVEGDGRAKPTKDDLYHFVLQYELCRDAEIRKYNSKRAVGEGTCGDISTEVAAALKIEDECRDVARASVWRIKDEP